MLTKVFRLSCFVHVIRAGGNLETLDGISFLPAPPVSLLLDQQLVEKSSVTTDGERIKQAYTEQELFGISCSVNGEALTLYGTEMKVQLDTPSSCKYGYVRRNGRLLLSYDYFLAIVMFPVPNRSACSLVEFSDVSQGVSLMNGSDDSARAAKRVKLHSNGDVTPADVQDLMTEVERFASILSYTLQLDSPLPPTRHTWD